MSVHFPILDLQTAPHCTYELHDRLCRIRVKIIIETKPSTTIGHHSAALAMTALIASVAGYPFADVTCTRADEGMKYEVTVRGQPNVTGIVTFMAEEDGALDGDAENWQQAEMSERDVLQFGGALQLWLNLNLPV